MKVKSQLKVTFYFSSVGDIPVRKLHVVGQTQFLGNIIDKEEKKKDKTNECRSEENIRSK